MLTVLDHPLILHRLARLRARDTDTETFRRLLFEVGQLMTWPVLHHLPMTTRAVETPLAAINAPVPADDGRLTFVPILRAGLPMAEGMASLAPWASMGHIGVFRDHDTHRPVEYLVKLPPNHGQPFVVVDPMLATGHSAIHAIDVLRRHGIAAASIRFAALVAAPEGVEALTAAHPDVPVFTAALDSHLNENAYIVPGLGDAGDRLFGTE